MPTQTATAISGSRTLHRLIYASRMLLEESQVEAEVDGIVRASIRNNSALGVTGLLLVQANWFLQALEGPAEAVLGIYRRITDDPRHSEPRVLFAGPVERREFADWNMCARRMSPADDAILATLSRRALTVGDLTGPTALRLLKVIRGIQQRTQVQMSA